ncbi:conserved unknown protein [Ectocarpus siliculosus]|uniref:Uncharacterized protein n=1 Tax=Ectocarpus siliculosus TaxID=2880 RepID=D7FNQ0_ECTSI|nr:conserved unknown protein [Ectocarpus siliculosus]|eukprot:CBJ26061.1 conserved unknown protein [Ectocarpus siliculosus]
MGNAGRGAKKTISFWPLVLLIFYGVSGGPFGVEPVVSAAGPFLALMGFLFLPMVWSIPEALVTAELSTTFPEAAGCVAWVSTAFGPFWGWMEGYASWMSGVADNSLYPVLFLDYLVSLLPRDNFLREDGLGRWGCVVCLNLALSYLAYRGLRVVGRTAIAVAVFSLLPFVVLVLWGLPDCTMPESWISPPDGGWGAIRWGTYLNVMFWNLNYWDSAASFAGEVENPGRTYPRALVACVALVVLCYGLPIFVGTGAASVAAAAAAAASAGEGGRWSLWEDGYFAEVAEAITGRWLGVWVVLAAAAANIGLFEAEMTSDALQLMGMAERGMLPAVFAKRGPHGISTLAIVASSTGVAFLGLLGFETIVEILNLLYCFAEILEFVAFIKLRVSHRDMHRPYEIPLGTVGVCLLLLPAASFVLLLAAFSSVITWVVSGVALLIGVGLYPGLLLAKREKWCEFRSATRYEGDVDGADNAPLYGN